MEPAERTAQVQVSRIGSFLQRGQNSRLKKKKNQTKKKEKEQGQASQPEASEIQGNKKQNSHKKEGALEIKVT